MVVPDRNTKAFYWSIFAVGGVFFDLFKNFIQKANAIPGY